MWVDSLIDRKKQNVYESQTFYSEVAAESGRLWLVEKT